MPGLDYWIRRFFPGLAPENCLVITDDGFRLLAADGRTFAVVISEITKVAVFRRITPVIDIDIFVVWTTSNEYSWIAFDDLTHGCWEVYNKMKEELPNFLGDWFTVLNGTPSETPVVIFERTLPVDQN